MYFNRYTFMKILDFINPLIRNYKDFLKWYNDICFKFF